MLTAEALGEIADQLIGHFVDQASRSGTSWTDIGKCMGVTKQAAQKRFVPKAQAGPFDPDDGFSRFTPRARNVVVDSQNRAYAAGNDEIAAVTLPPKANTVPALIPFNAHARKVLELTFREALRLGNNHIGTEHVLLALLEAEAENGPLHDLGLHKQLVENEITEALRSLVEG